MATEGPLKELCQEASCSICLDYFRDPVTLPECGHNFCRACLTRSWEESGGAQRSSCPQCRRKARKRKLHPNLQLANMVELIQKLSPPEGTEAKAKGRLCERHQEPMELFCRDERITLCAACARCPRHRNHKVIPLQEEEAAREKKEQFCNCLELLKKERERILAFKGDVEKESRELLEQTEGQKQETVDKFRQLHAILEQQEKLLLAQMEEVGMEVARNGDQHLAELSEELSSLDSLIRKMEENCEEPVGDLLQDAKSTLQRYKEKESFENPATFTLALKWRVWDCSDLNLLLEGLKKQLTDTLDSGLHPQKANVTLDPDTAHPRLLLSEGQKSVKQGRNFQDLPTNRERFDQRSIVLGREGFTGGRHFWEVLVGSQGEWTVGVARKSVKRKGGITFSPEEGFWAVGNWRGSYKASGIDHDPPLNLTGELKRVRVCLNYAGGRVAFFDADRAALLYEFSGASSGETLLPFFWVDSKGHLKITS